jgi:hypothetical protein
MWKDRVGVKRKGFIIGFVLLILTVLSFALLTRQDKNEVPKTQTLPQTPSEVIDVVTPQDSEQKGEPITVEAEGTCLLHRDSNVATAECAMGIKTNNGTYYAIKDSTSDYSLVSQIQTGERVRISGNLVIKEDEIYQSSGTLTVKAVEEL